MAITKAKAVQLEDFVVTSGEFTGVGNAGSPFALGTVPVSKGGTGANANTGTGSNVLGAGPTLSGLILAAGVATAGGAPLKFTSGTNTTTAVAGQMEYNGTILTFTPTGTTRQTFAYLGLAQTFTAQQSGTTPTAGDNTTKFATTAFVQNAITAPVVDIVNTTVVSLVSGTKYYANHAGLSTGLLPTTAAKGSQILMRGQGTGGWRISQNANQKIHGASDSTAGTAGFLASQTQYDTVVLECMVANLEWIIVANRGTLTIS